MAKMMLEIPDALEDMLPAIEKLLKTVEMQVERGVALSPTSAYERFEATLRDSLCAVERAAHGVALAALDVDEPRVRLNGIEHVRVGRYATTFMSQAGEVRVTRSLYRHQIYRNGPLR